MKSRTETETARYSSNGVAGAANVTLADVAGLLRRIHDTLAADRAELIDADAAAALIGVSRATWDRMRSAGLVPAPVKLNHGSIIRWRRAELVKWIEDGCPALE